MTITAGASVALACIIAPWVAKIVAVLGAIVKTIVAIAENIRNTLPELGACCRKKTGRQSARANFGQAVTMDLRGTSEARIKAEFAGPSAVEPWRRLMAVLAAPRTQRRYWKRAADMPPRKNCTRVWPIGESLVDYRSSRFTERAKNRAAMNKAARTARKT